VQPGEELLKPGIRHDLLHAVHRVPQLIVAPGFMDEVLAGLAGWHGFVSAFAPRHHMMLACFHPSMAKNTSAFGCFIHALFCQAAVQFPA
jgi:hypothetical protein